MEWMDVDEVCPQENIEIIVSGNHTCKVWCTEIYITREGQVLDWTTYRDVEITHWMPLPSPPKE